MKHYETKHDYAVMESTSATSFLQVVKSMMKDKWKPAGGVSIALDGSNVIYAQALTKDTTEEVKDES